MVAPPNSVPPVAGLRLLPGRTRRAKPPAGANTHWQSHKGLAAGEFVLHLTPWIPVESLSNTKIVYLYSEYCISRQENLYSW
jgi:hypothetical protein